MAQAHKRTRKERGLGKYDAPLKFQYEQGYSDFKRGRVNSPSIRIRCSIVSGIGVLTMPILKT